MLRFGIIRQPAAVNKADCIYTKMDLYVLGISMNTIYYLMPPIKILANQIAKPESAIYIRHLVIFQCEYKMFHLFTAGFSEVLFYINEFVGSLVQLEYMQAAGVGQYIIFFPCCVMQNIKYGIA